MIFACDDCPPIITAIPSPSLPGTEPHVPDASTVRAEADSLVLREVSMEDSRCTRPLRPRQQETYFALAATASFTGSIAARTAVGASAVVIVIQWSATCPRQG
jgi:hypothetical protein